MRSAPAALRNREPIADVLAGWLPASGLVLEIATGSGEHVVHFASRFPNLAWQPSDPDEEARASIAARLDDCAFPNIEPPLRIDAVDADWPVARVDAALCINMVHISPWAATLGLVAGAAQCLAPGAPLILYGPYREFGVTTAPSNELFDASLKVRDPAWGLRSLGAMCRAAAPWFVLHERVNMPANNLMLLFIRTIEARA